MSKQMPRGFAAFAHRSLMVLAQALLALLAGEVTVRVLSPQALVVPWQDEVMGIICPRPHVQGRHYVPDTFEVQIAFSGQRFRGTREYTKTPATGMLRVAVLGDSFTLGFGANDDETWPAATEHALARASPGTPWASGVEVINAGNGGTGIGEQALWFDTWVRSFHPRVVVLAATLAALDADANRHLFRLDEHGSAAPLPSSSRQSADTPLRVVRFLANHVPFYETITQRSHLLAFIRYIASTLVSELRQLVTRSPSPSSPASVADPNLPYRVAQAEVRWLADKVRDAGAELIIVFIPNRELIYPASQTNADKIGIRSAALVNALNAIGREAGIRVADLITPMKKEAATRIGPLYYDGGDTHPNRDGYACIGEAVASAIRSALPLNNRAAGASSQERLDVYK